MLLTLLFALLQSCGPDRAEGEISLGGRDVLGGTSTLVAEATIRVLVLRADGSPVEGARVYARASSDERYAFIRVNGTHGGKGEAPITTANGIALVDVSSDAEHYIVVRASSGEEVRQRADELRPGEVRDIRVVMSEGSALHGIVVDSVSRSPLKDICIELLGPTRTWIAPCGLEYSERLLWSGRTDEFGEFTASVPHSHSGAFIRLTSDAYATCIRSLYDSGEYPLVIALEKPSALSIRFSAGRAESGAEPIEVCVEAEHRLGLPNTDVHEEFLGVPNSVWRKNVEQMSAVIDFPSLPTGGPLYVYVLQGGTRVFSSPPILMGPGDHREVEVSVSERADIRGLFDGHLESGWDYKALLVLPGRSDLHLACLCSEGFLFGVQGNGEFTAKNVPVGEWQAKVIRIRKGVIEACSQWVPTESRVGKAATLIIGRG